MPEIDNNGDEIILESQEDTDLDLDIESEDDEESEEIDWRAEAKKAKKIANNQKIRAEKAEEKLKNGTKPETKAPIKTDKPAELSPKDVYSLMNAKVAEEDIEDVLEYAQFKKISVADALKSPILRATLKEKTEERNVAAATHTGTGKRAGSKISDEALINKASKGELPDDIADIERINAQRWGIKG